MAIAVLAVGCGGDDDDSSGGEGGGKTVTIYSSLPLQGDSRPMSESILNGQKLALKDVRGRAGRYRVRLVSLDDALASTGKWDAGQTSSNARRAAGDESAVVYLGEYNSGASVANEGIDTKATRTPSSFELAVDLLVVGDEADEGCKRLFAGLLQISPGTSARRSGSTCPRRSPPAPGTRTSA